jgi:hypothetical protein
MDKKTKTIIIVVLAVVVVGGLYFGYNRWQQQRLAAKILKNMYGVGSGKAGDITAQIAGQLSPDMLKKMAEEAAKEEAQQKTDEEKEAAKTPEDKFNETKSVTLAGKTAPLVKDIVEPRLTAVFGKAKPTLFSGGYMGQEDSFLVSFKVPKVITDVDINKLVEEFTNNGYTVVMNSVSADAANLLFENDKSTISISYEDPTAQEIGIIYAGKTNE